MEELEQQATNLEEGGRRFHQITNTCTVMELVSMVDYCNEMMSWIWRKKQTVQHYCFVLGNVVEDEIDTVVDLGVGIVVVVVVVVGGWGQKQRYTDTDTDTDVVVQQNWDFGNEIG